MVCFVGWSQTMQSQFFKAFSAILMCFSFINSLTGLPLSGKENTITSFAIITHYQCFIIIIYIKITVFRWDNHAIHCKLMAPLSLFYFFLKKNKIEKKYIIKIFSRLIAFRSKGGIWKYVMVIFERCRKMYNALKGLVL